MYAKIWNLTETLLLKGAVEDPTTHSVIGYGPSVQGTSCEELVRLLECLADPPNCYPPCG